MGNSWLLGKRWRSGWGLAYCHGDVEAVGGGDRLGVEKCENELRMARERRRELTAGSCQKQEGRLPEVSEGLLSLNR